MTCGQFKPQMDCCRNQQKHWRTGVSWKSYSSFRSSVPATTDLVAWLCRLMRNVTSENWCMVCVDNRPHGNPGFTLTGLSYPSAPQLLRNLQLSIWSCFQYSPREICSPITLWMWGWNVILSTLAHSTSLTSYLQQLVLLISLTSCGGFITQYHGEWKIGWPQLGPCNDHLCQ